MRAWDWSTVTAAPRLRGTHYSRVLQPAALLLSDEGLNGLDLHAINDGPTAINGTLRVEAFSGANCVASAELACAVGPRSSATFRAESVLGSFLDVTYAYRFGPRSIDTVAGLWYCDGALVSRAVFVPDGAPLPAGGARTLRDRSTNRRRHLRSRDHHRTPAADVRI